MVLLPSSSFFLFFCFWAGWFNSQSLSCFGPAHPFPDWDSCTDGYSLSCSSLACHRSDVIATNNIPVWFRLGVLLLALEETQTKNKSQGDPTPLLLVVFLAFTLPLNLVPKIVPRQVGLGKRCHSFFGILLLLLATLIACDLMTHHSPNPTTFAPVFCHITSHSLLCFCFCFCFWCFCLTEEMTFVPTQILATPATQRNTLTTKTDLKKHCSKNSEPNFSSSSSSFFFASLLQRSLFLITINQTKNNAKQQRQPVIHFLFVDHETQTNTQKPFPCIRLFQLPPPPLPCLSPFPFLLFFFWCVFAFSATTHRCFIHLHPIDQ